MAVVDTVATASAPCALADLVSATGLSRATAHRLAVALEAHDLLRRTPDGRFSLGLRLMALGQAAAEDWPLADIARPALVALRDQTGESAQLYVREGDHRVCLASLDSAHELRTIVEEGARLPLGVGSAGRILTGERRPEGYSSSTGERAPGVGSVSAPIVVDGVVVAAVGISGPLDRLGVQPGPRFGPAVVRAATAVAEALTAAATG